MDAFTDNTVLEGLWMQVRAQTAEDEALRQVYGIGVEELFAQAEGSV